MRPDRPCSKCREPLDGAHGTYCKRCLREYYREYWKKRPREQNGAVNRQRAKRNGGKAIPYSRMKVWIRDQGVCHICKQFTTQADFTLDHIVPISLGGNDEWDNVKVAHFSCNARRGNRVVTEGMRL